MAMAFPLPQIGKPAKVLLDGLPLMIVPGTYKVLEPQRFGDKLSVGALKYSDFNAFESAQSFSYLSGGYGLRRYSDLDLTTNQYNQMATVSRASSMYKESSNVDARFGPVILSAKLTPVTLPGSNYPPIWIGEWTPTAQGVAYLTVVTRRDIFYFNGSSWLKAAYSAPQDIIAASVGVFGGKLILGFGAAALGGYYADVTAGALTPLVLDTSGSLYVFAFTDDRSNAYIAGGLAATDVNLVYASVDGVTYQATSKAICGGTQSKITELAPGGGLEIVMVGKETELGAIDNSAIYRQLVPLDTKLSTNCQVLRWWMGASGDEQRGPMIIVFSRDNSIWAYEPASELSGKAENISPWADLNIRPPTARGRLTAVHGTARWLYMTIQAQDGHSWIISRDSRTGASHTTLDLGLVSTQAIAVTSLLSGANPHLVIGSGNNLVTAVLPIDGDTPLDEATCTYASTGYIDIPDIDLGFPDEDKVLLAIRLACDNILIGTRYIKVWASFDGGDLKPFGIVENNFTEILFDPHVDPTVVKRLGIRLVLYSTSEVQTPQLLGLSVRMSLNPRVYRQWAFQAVIPGGSSPMGIDLLEDPHDKIRDLWTSRRAGTLIPFVDRWNDVYQVRILTLGESEKFEEPDRVAETVIDVLLLEAGSTQPGMTFFAAPSGSTAFFPFMFPWNVLYSSLLNYSNTTVNNPSSIETDYPIWNITGPGHFLTLTSLTSGESFSLDATLSPGEIVQINFDPTRKTVISSTRGDLSSSVVSGSVYWGLAPGDNQVTITLGNTSSESQVELIRNLPITY